MLNLLPRRLRGLTPTTPTCIRCSINHIHTSQSARWRTREERREALHSKDDRDTGRRHHAAPSYPRRTSAQPSRPREYARAPREAYPSMNPYKKQVRPDRRDNLGVFSKPSRGPEYPAHLQRGEVRHPGGMKNEERLRIESRDKINTAYNLAKELPPLTDEDYRQVYEELLTYDPAPASPSEQRLALEAGSSSSTPLLGAASKTAKERISELLERLNRRVPEAELPLPPIPGGEEKEESLLSKLSKMRQSTAASPKQQGESGTLSSILEREAPEEDGETRNTSTSLSTSQSAQSNNTVGATRRPHARTRGKIFNALSQLLQPLPGTKARSPRLIIGEQPPNTVTLDIATKQEWAALVLEAADDRSLTDVITTFELMKRAGVALSEELLAAAIRLISKDQKLVPTLLQYFEQNDIAIPLTAHHEVVVGVLQNSPSNMPTSKAEGYLRALEAYNRPALAKTYAAVIKHIFQLRRQTGIRARAWNLYGHMRLVAHPTPSVEVFDAMIYGCSLDDRVSPERALDLFTEMIELGIKPSYNTYLGLIRTCAKDKDTSKESPFYFESLRSLKELLDRGFKPEKDIFNSILEGSRIRGDLFRSKWIVSNMLQLASRSENPRENPTTPDLQIMQSLFLTAATYRPPNMHKNAIKLKEVGSTPLVGDEALKEEDNQEETPNTSNQMTEEAASATETENNIESVTSKLKEEPSQSTLHVAGDDDASLNSYYPQHPLHRQDLPQSTHQLLDDLTQIMGTLLEVHGLSTDVLSDQTSASFGMSVVPIAGTDVSTFNGSEDTHYSSGLDEGTLEALRNVPIHNVLFNAYLTLLIAHGRTNSALSFFNKAFPAFNIQPSYHTWEILFDTLNSSSRQKEREVRMRIRSEKAVKARELFKEWEEWLKNKLMQTEETPPWFARHIETIYAHHLGVHARAQQVDEGLSVLREFYSRFPPDRIVQAARSEKINAGPSYLIQLSSFLYPETMDASSSTAYKSASDLTGGQIIRKPLIKSQINSFNLFGLPPILSYQMVYSLFHRLREEEDDRAMDVIDTLKEYRKALEEALTVREDLERKQRSAKMETEARKGIINQPGRGIPNSTLPRTSQTLLGRDDSRGGSSARVEALSKGDEA